MSREEVKIMAPKPNVYAVIPASGEGERFGSEIPKQVRHFFYLLAKFFQMAFTHCILIPASTIIELLDSLKYFQTD